jgi:hypothetical protein
MRPLAAGVYRLMGERPQCPVCGCMLAPGQIHCADGGRDGVGQGHVSYEVNGERWVQVTGEAG